MTFSDASFSSSDILYCLLIKEWSSDDIDAFIDEH